MTTAEQTAAAKAFAEEWKGKGDEKQHTQLFWIGFIRRVLGVEDAEQHIQFEKQVKYGGHTTFIDELCESHGKARRILPGKNMGANV